MDHQILSFLLPLFIWHNVYITIVEIKRADPASNVTIVIKIFTDDLEDAIKADYGKDVMCRTPQQLSQHRSFIERYINDHFKLTINEQVKGFEYYALTNEDIATFVELLTVVKGDIHQVTVETDILLNLFPNQQNIVSLDINGKKDFLRLNNSKRSGELQY